MRGCMVVLSSLVAWKPLVLPTSVIDGLVGTQQLALNLMMSVHLTV